MKKTSFISFLLIAIAVVTFTSCTTVHKTMKEANTLVELKKADFVLSDQVTGDAKSVKILGIDWARLFTKRTGMIEGGSSSVSFASIPVIGNMLMDKTANYSLYELMQGNPGYDVVFYPQYETKIVRPILAGFIFKITTVKTTARLGKFVK